jgi:hypothetical protein
VTLPSKNVSLAECLFPRKEYGNDENGKSAIHALIQARSSANGRGRSEHCRRGTHIGRGQTDSVQLGVDADRKLTTWGCGVKLGLVMP